MTKLWGQLLRDALILGPLSCVVSLSCTLFNLSGVMVGSGASEVWACGVNSHLWITDSAICQLPMTSPLRALYEEQRYVDLTRLGSAFPDSGYAINHDYGEVAHWPPFIQSYIENFHTRFGADETAWGDEAWSEVAFILGVTAHGVEDELFDSQYLRWVEQEDEAGQDILDPGLDFLLVYEGQSALYPPNEFPASGVTAALQSADIAVTEDDVRLGVSRVRLALSITQAPTESLRSQVERVTPLMPWATRHYQDRRARGSLGHEPRIIAALLWATYLRLRGETVAELALAALDPAPPERLNRAGITAGNESRWISLYFAVAADAEDLRGALTLSDADGVELDYEWRDTRWGGGRGFTHIFEIAPRALTLEQRALTLELTGGVRLINGEMTSETQRMLIEVCDAETCVTPEANELRWGGRARGCWVTPETSDMGSPDAELSEMNEEDSMTLEEVTEVIDMDIHQARADQERSASAPMDMEFRSRADRGESAGLDQAESTVNASSGCDHHRLRTLRGASTPPTSWGLVALLSALTLSRLRRRGTGA